MYASTHQSPTLILETPPSLIVSAVVFCDRIICGSASSGGVTNTTQHAAGLAMQYARGLMWLTDVAVGYCLSAAAIIAFLKAREYAEPFTEARRRERLPVCLLLLMLFLSGGHRRRLVHR